MAKRARHLPIRLAWAFVCICVLAPILAALVGIAGHAYAADFDADAVDIWLVPSQPHVGDTADIKAKFKNLSSSSGPYGGEATFDAAIVVFPPSGGPAIFSKDNWQFSLNQTRTLAKVDYTFNQEGTYTIYAEIYDINGKQSGWDSANRFDRRVETFNIVMPTNPPTRCGSY